VKRRPAAAPIGAAVLLVAMALLFGMRPAWFTTNDVTTGSAPGYPDLTAHRYAEPPAEVVARARALAGAIPRWSVVSELPVLVREYSTARGVVRDYHGLPGFAVEVRTALFNFTDDLTVKVETDGSGSRVVIRSRSRVGRGDLGENARHIAALQRRMDAALTRR
jgi:hypothetical protein